jgi:hypothetical protein
VDRKIKNNGSEIEKNGLDKKLNKKSVGPKNIQLDGPNRLNRTETDRTGEPETEKNRMFKWFEMGLDIPTVGSTGSVV